MQNTSDGCTNFCSIENNSNLEFHLWNKIENMDKLISHHKHFDNLKYRLVFLMYGLCLDRVHGYKN